ncbi:aminotransferase, partial [Streptomyces sp. NPDC127044]
MRAEGAYGGDGHGAGSRGDDAHDLRHHGDAEVRDDGSALTDLAVNVRAEPAPGGCGAHVAAALGRARARP